jgi:hypothetical protein
MKPPQQRPETPTEMMDDMAEYAERQVAPVYQGRPAAPQQQEEEQWS